ncbi:DUF2062 domain-containing protein [Acidobacteria bacterium AH-259-G07]|nr:DUF2062 domain-containing protein [Acidobacteria bacterium AH-259-G07]
MKRIYTTIRSLLLVQDTLERTALAFSLGVFLGFSPLIGLHAILALIVAFAFRLNKVAVLIGASINNPWTIVPYYSFATWFGIQLIGVPEGISLPQVGLSHLLQGEFWTWLLSQWRLLIPAFLGSLVLCTILSLFSYALALILLKRYSAAS